MYVTMLLKFVARENAVRFACPVQVTQLYKTDPISIAKGKDAALEDDKRQY